MRDPRLDKLADVLVKYSTKVKKGDLVSIGADPVAMPLVEATFEAVLRAGGHPFWQLRSSTLAEIYLEHASDEQLDYLNPVDMYAVETIDVSIGLWADVNTKALSRIDPKRVSRQRLANKPKMIRTLNRAAAGEHRWCGTMYPTISSAQDAEMSLSQYEKFVFEAGLLHLPDPVSAWEEIHQRQQLVCDYLQQKNELHFKAPARDGHDGTNLRVNVDNTKSIWVNCSGGENFPDGEVFCGPQGADGHVNYTFPAVYDGREVEGVRLEFKDNRVVNASATKNEEFLFAMLDQDKGAREMGEIAIGTNYSIKEFSKNTLFDEKIGGTFHAACGMGYPESGSFNESGLHWDMVCDLREGGTIQADGEIFHKDGKFLKDGWPGE
ncbi:MAG: aminopeptidase [Phycisphaerales bacterium]|nr:aminopeptidase [Phycisphaerales bacterium]